MLKWLFGQNGKGNNVHDSGAITSLYEGDRGIVDLHEND